MPASMQAEASTRKHQKSLLRNFCAMGTARQGNFHGESWYPSYVKNFSSAEVFSNTEGLSYEFFSYCDILNSSQNFIKSPLRIFFRCEKPSETPKGPHDFFLQTKSYPHHFVLPPLWLTKLFCTQEMGGTRNFQKDRRLLEVQKWSSYQSFGTKRQKLFDLSWCYPPIVYPTFLARRMSGVDFDIFSACSFCP